MYTLYSLVPTTTDCVPWGSELCSGSSVRGGHSPQKKKRETERAREHERKKERERDTG